MTRQTLARLGRVAGYGIVLAACVFVVSRIIDSGIGAAIVRHGTVLLATVAAGSVLYASAGLLLAAAWIRLLGWCGQPPPSARSGVAIYARTQIAKYLPGNVFHLLGRHLAGRSAGLGHTPMVCAAWFESVTLVSAAAVLSLVGLATWGSFGTPRLLPLLATALAFALIAPFAMATLLPLISRLTGQRMPAERVAGLGTGIVVPYLLYVTFFSAAGAILWLQAFGLGETGPTLLPAVVSIAAGAWILGFLTPGAAAGLGVREALLIAGLSDGLGVENAALVALAFRATTLIGDTLFFLGGLALAGGLPARAPEAEPGS